MSQSSGRDRMPTELNPHRRQFIGGLAAIPAAQLVGIWPIKASAGKEATAEPSVPQASKPYDERTLSSLAGATEWLNSSPLRVADLRGKVVLVQFWTYTCINWLRTLPYVRAWSEKYKDQGLAVIGVHSPE